MAKKSTEELLDEIESEASNARSEMGSAKSGLKKAGEEADVETEESEETEDVSEEEDEQNLENEEDQEDEPDEESEESTDVEGEEEDQEEDSRFNPNAARRILAKKDQQLAELQAKVSEYENAKSESKKQSIEEEIGAIADELKLDKSGLAKISSKILEIAERNLQSKLPPAAIVEDYENRQEEKHFESEWKSFTPNLAKTYPKMSAVQLEQAKELMDALSHDEEYGGVKITGKDGKPRLQPYSFDYIMFKNKREFDRILSAGKRRGLESASSAAYDINDEPTDLSSSRGIDAADKKYRDVEANSSGLRRGRSPKNRSI